MIKFHKTVSIAYVALFIYAWGMISKTYNLPTILAEAWFVVSFYVLCAYALLSVIAVLPILSMSYSEAKTAVSKFGTESHSKFLWVYPFIAFAALFVQFGDYVMAFCSIACWSVTALLHASHDKVLKQELIDAARRGNVE